MTEPDITAQLTADVSSLTLIEAAEITRQGKNGGWRISLPMHDEITIAGQVAPIIRPRAPLAYDFADLAFDPHVQALYAELRDVTIRIARGDLKPIPPAVPTAIQ